MYKKYYFILLALCVPFFASAGYFDGGPNGGIDGFFVRLNGFVSNVLIPFFFTLALAVFIYGMYRWFIQGGGNETDREKGKQLALWAVAGFVLMVSIWGIVILIATGLGFTGGQVDQYLPVPPTVNSPGAGS